MVSVADWPTSRVSVCKPLTVRPTGPLHDRVMVSGTLPTLAKVIVSLASTPGSVFAWARSPTNVTAWISGTVNVTVRESVP